MNVVMADVQADALDQAAAEIGASGAPVLAYRLDVSKAAEVEALGAATLARFGVPNFVFNNAGVGCGGLIWENTLQDWEWVLGVNLMGVVHGLRVFTPMMLDAARKDAGLRRPHRQHRVDGRFGEPAEHGRVQRQQACGGVAQRNALPGLAPGERAGHAPRCCAPSSSPPASHSSQRNRPAELHSGAAPTKSQLIGQAMSDKAVGSGKVTAAMVAQYVFDALREQRFYIYSHPQALASVQTRLEDVVQNRNPSDPFAHKPEIGDGLRAALRAAE